MPTIRRRTLVALGLPALACAGAAVALALYGQGAPVRPAADSHRTVPRAIPTATPAPVSAGASTGYAAATRGSQVPAGTNTRPSALPAAPLAATQLPDSVKAEWKPIGPPVSRSIGHHVGLNECAGLDGESAWLEQGWASAADTPAIQDSFTFATPAGALHAFQQITAGMSNCTAQLRALQAQNELNPDAASQQTASFSTATAWQYEWDAVPGMSAPGSQIHHVYAAVHDSDVTILQYTDLGSAAEANSSSPASDLATLRTIASQLSSAP